MRENGTDRDVALMIIGNLQNINANLEDINNNLYGVYIHTQPTDQEAVLGGTATFSVVASNVVSYQWQARNPGQDTWSDATSLGSNTASWSFTATEASFARTVRCKMIGKDGETVYTNVCTLTKIEAGG